MEAGYGKYDDIINLPHHSSKLHPHMSMHDRAAQFAPFAALTGYEEAIDESSRLTEKRIELGEDEKQQLNEKLRAASENRDGIFKFTFFVPDERKSGGAYVDKSGQIKKIDTDFGLILLKDHTSIAINDIIRIEAESPGSQ